MFRIHAKDGPGISVRALAEAAILIAAAFALSYIRIDMPQGGAFTPASSLPILLIGYRWGRACGFTAAIAYSLLQMLQSFYPPPANTLSAFALVVLLDYVIAFAALGASSFFKGRKNGLLIAVPVCLGVRFLCHFLSGILIWGSYAWEGFSPWLYSFLYNGSYMSVEMALTFIGALMLTRSRLSDIGLAKA